MKKIIGGIGAAVLSGLAVFMVGMQVQAEPTRATMPEIDKLIHYTTVTRGEVTEHLMTTREAIEAVQKGQPIPAGTQVALVDYRDGKVFRYFIMEKGQNWGADYDERRRTGDWQFQWFKPDGTINTPKTPRAVSLAIRRGRTGTFSILLTRCGGSNQNEQRVPASACPRFRRGRIDRRLSCLLVAGQPLP